MLSLGETPVADLLVTDAQLGQREQKYLLEVAFCPDCYLLQLTSAAPPEHIYGDDYPYFTSALPGLVEHYRKSALELIDRHRLGPSSLVIEAGSNDGYMLEVLAGNGVQVLGIDPAPLPARIANEKGLRTVCDYFSRRLAKKLRDEGIRADALVANNLLNLIPDPKDFVQATDLLLKKDGVAVVEVPSVVEMVDNCAYDNIFHQNRSYWSLSAIKRLFGGSGMFVTDVMGVPTFGGSYRVFIERRDRPSEAAQAAFAEEARREVTSLHFYETFGVRARQNQEKLVRLLMDLNWSGEKVAAYGAAGGMATTLLSFAGIDGELIDFAVDTNSFKHGKYTSGSHILISPTDRLLEEMPGYVLLLAWNYADEVLEQQAEYRRRGGKFIIPVPEVRIV